MEASGPGTRVGFGTVEVPFSAHHYREIQGGAVSADVGTEGHLDLIQASNLALTTAELETLGRLGFVISERRTFPSFLYGYDTIYSEDLPVYVSADAILESVHRSYDRILQHLEEARLIPALDALLTSMRTRLAAGEPSGADATVRTDVDVFLTVALSLLRGTTEAPVAGASGDVVRRFLRDARAADGVAERVLFGTSRLIDASQFKPRGHYTRSPELERYFRAMIWLGRTDLRLIETDSDGNPLFRRRQVEAMVALRALIDERAIAHYRSIDRVVEAFVGEHDSMTVPEVDRLLADLGVASLADLAPLSDEAIARAIVEGGYGAQRIASQVIIRGAAEDTLPLSSSFALLGQRYVVDSHVFSNVVFDRVDRGAVLRMMPNPLDVAFGALRNDHAAALLRGELEKYPYAPELFGARVMVEAHEPSFWEANLYNRWLGALRTLSPKGDLDAARSEGLMAVATTEAFGRRLLNTQLASWAELRRNTVLYAKQSYTSGAVCEFPDGYVDPYPEFFAALVGYALHGQRLADELLLGGVVKGYFEELAQIAALLEEMATYEREGRPFTPSHLAFLNEAVRLQWGCGDIVGADGWLARLHFAPAKAVEFDPIIADVHTQPTDEGGAFVGRVLHVATGAPRMLVVTANTCSGPRAYVGLASSYFEKITDNFQRLNDQEWATEIQDGNPSDVPWMTDLVVR